MINPFAHLHVHSDHSVLDGAAQITGIVKAAVADNQPGVALTDHGSMSGAVDLLRAAEKDGVTGIVGNEMYMAVGSRTERQTVISSADVDPDDSGNGRSKTKRYFHLTALAENTAGYRNLTKLSSQAWIDGFWAKPRADHELLAAHGDGLILLTGCLGGEVANELLAGNFRAACDVVDRMRAAVGKDSVYVEVMDHGIAAQRRIIPDLYRLADELGVKTVVTNDSHYVSQGDAHTHDALLAVQTGCLLHDNTRFRFNGDGHYVKTAAEMRAVSDDRWWRAGCDSTLEIVERVAAGGGNSIIPNTATLPRFPLPHPWSEMPYHEAVPKYLMHLTFTGAQQRYGHELSAAVKERLRFEFDTIVGMGFAAYFLIVHELISWCREQNIRVGPGRGSAAGCAISYCLGVVGVDPIGNDLLFERFLNPDRVSMPDIDMDFEDRHRDRVIDHLRDVYGSDAVAQLGTFGVIGARQATKDAARILARPNAWATELTALMPALYMGRDTPLVKCLGLNGNDPHPGAGDLRDRYLTDDTVREALDLAVGFEGLIRAEGRHASAVVITDGPVMDHLPVRQTWKSDGAGGYEQDGPITTVYDGSTVEGLGFLKLDVLGLRNLTIMERCLDHVEARTGVRPDIDDLPDDFEDPTSLAAWKMLQAGDAVGVFQFESAPMRDILRRAKPTTRTELAALNALYRPGAMRYIDPFIARRHGREEISYDQWTRDPAAVEILDRILGPTMGFPLFQEQSMKLAKDLAGFTPGKADELRKACLPAGSLVLTHKYGYVPIENVMKLKDHRVQVIDDTSFRSRIGRVADVWGVGPKTVFALTTSSGNRIEATGNHPLLSDTGWQDLSRFKPGDLVAVAKRTVTQSVNCEFNRAAVRLAALLISEGSMNPKTGVPTYFCNKDEELLDAFRSSYEEFFGAPYPGGSRVSVHATSGVTYLRMTRAEIGRLAAWVGPFALSRHKVLPPAIVNLPVSGIKQFLGDYLSCDGWVDAAGVHYTSRSENVCRNLKRMLLRLGIESRLYSTMRVGEPQWSVSVSDKRDAARLLDEIGPHICRTKQERLTELVASWADKACGRNDSGVPVSFYLSEVERRSAVTGMSKNALGLEGGGWRRATVMHPDTARTILYSEKLHDAANGDLTWEVVTSIVEVGVKECFDFRMEDPSHPYAVIEDFLVHNCGKKDWAKMNALEPVWMDGIEARFGDPKFAAKLWDAVKASADYSFNKSHSLCYGGYIAWQTVWLKANYPVEYMAAWLECAKGPERRAELYVECRAMEIGLLPPDVNLSESWPTPEDGKIRLGFAVIKSLAKVVGSLMVEREARGPFVSFADLCARVPDLSRAQLDVLVKSGACDRFGPRLGLMVVADVYKSAGKSGRSDLLVDVPVPPVEMSAVDRLRFELAALSTTVTGSLVDHAARSLKAEGARPVSAVFTAAPHTTLKVGGVLSSAAVQASKKGNWFGRFTLEGAAGVVPIVVFQKTLEELAGVLNVPLSTKLGDLLVGLPVAVTGRVQIDEVEQVDDGVDEDAEEQREMIAYSVTPVGFDDGPDPAAPAGPVVPSGSPTGSGQTPEVDPAGLVAADGDAGEVAPPSAAAAGVPAPVVDADVVGSSVTAPPTPAPPAPTPPASPAVAPPVTAEVAGDVTDTAARPPVTDVPTPVVVFFLNALGAIPTLSVTAVMAHQFEQVADRFGAAKWVDPASGRVVVMVPWPGASERNVVQVAAAKLRELGVAGKIGEFVVYPAEHLYITAEAAAEVARTVLVAEPQVS